MQVERCRLCVSLHDVAPATLDDCKETVAFLDALSISPISLLVVPDFHGLGRVDRDLRLCEFLHERARRGDEIVLHGFRHQDTAAPGRGIADWLERRVYTDREGEFSRLDSSTARARILRGLAVLRSAGWNPRGFVAPAWLMSPGTYDALESLPLSYCATRDFVLPLQSGRRIPAPSLVVATRSSWRRAASPVWNYGVLCRSIRAPVLRAALHPADIRRPGIASHWERLLGRLRHREVVTEGALLLHA